jgi:surface protein
MFAKCKSLKELNLNNFNFNNVVTMKGMFFECKSLEELNINNFNPNNEGNMSEMFFGCQNELIKKIKMKYKNIRESAF